MRHALRVERPERTLHAVSDLGGGDALVEQARVTDGVSETDLPRLHRQHREELRVPGDPDGVALNLAHGGLDIGGRRPALHDDQPYSLRSGGELVARVDHPQAVTRSVGDDAKTLGEQGARRENGGGHASEAGGEPAVLRVYPLPGPNAFRRARMAANHMGTTGWRVEKHPDGCWRSQNTAQLPGGTPCAE